jgi:hypothetical protein
MTMSILKSAAAVFLAGAGALAMSATAFAVTPTPAPAGSLTIVLTCDTGPTGSGTFTVTANGRTMTVTVGCGRRATVFNAAWKAGSTATIHQTVAPFGALLARNVTITLRTTPQTVTIRDFRTATTTAATLAQTGSGVPAFPIGLGLAGLLLVAIGGTVLTGRRETN